MVTTRQDSSLGKRVKLGMALLGASGLLALYLPTIALAVRTWGSNPYAGHSVFVPLFSILLLWWDRDRLLALQARPQRLLGLSILGGALALLAIGTVADNLSLQVLSFVPALFGFLIYHLGTVNVRLFAYPVSFLLLVHPIPNAVVAAVSPHVRGFAAELTSASLALLGIPHYQQGMFIYLPNIALEIAEGCNGLRFLGALFTLTAVLAHVTQRTPSRELALTAASIPLAILANAIRITAVTAGAYYMGPWVAADLPHHSIGKVVWLLTLLPLALLAYLLRRQKAPQGPSSEKPSSSVASGESQDRPLVEVSQQRAGEERVG